MSSFNFISNNIIRQALSTPKAQLRFWSKVVKCIHGEQCKECCWEWKASTRSAGYGDFILLVNGKRTKVLAHRVSYILSKDNIPYGALVRHVCPGKENRRCVNPRHLKVGKQKKDIHDAAVLKRFGSLTTETVKEIRRLYAEGVKRKTLASLFEVSLRVISEIVNYTRYTHIEWKKIKPKKKLVKRNEPKIIFGFVSYPRKKNVIL